MIIDVSKIPNKANFSLSRLDGEYRCDIGTSTTAFVGVAKTWRAAIERAVAKYEMGENAGFDLPETVWVHKTVRGLGVSKTLSDAPKNLIPTEYIKVKK